MRLAAPAVIAALALAACNQQAATTSPPVPADPGPPASPAAEAPALVGFSHQAAIDPLGFYMPASEVKVGNLRLRNGHIGTADDLAAWEGGKREPATYAPFMFEFDDVSSPEQTNEMGQTYHTVSRRVLPTAYLVSVESVRFAGHDEVLGDITFEGRFQGFPAAGRPAALGPGANGTVKLVGALTLGGKAFPVVLDYFGGD